MKAQLLSHFKAAIPRREGVCKALLAIVNSPPGQGSEKKVQYLCVFMIRLTT